MTILLYCTCSTDSGCLTVKITNDYSLGIKI